MFNFLSNINFITFFTFRFYQSDLLIVLFFIFQFYKVHLCKFHYFYILFFNLFKIDRMKGIKVACIEEIAFNKDYISSEKLKTLAQNLHASEYVQYLLNLTVK